MFYREVAELDLHALSYIDNINKKCSISCYKTFVQNKLINCLTSYQLVSCLFRY